MSKLSFPAQDRRTSPTAPPTSEGAARRLAGRIRVPYAVASVALVVSGAVVFTIAAWRISGRAPVLVVAQPIAAGQVIGESDVRTVNVGAPDSLDLVASINESKVVGHVAAMPLVPGTLLTTHMVGTSDFPPAGRSVVGVALKAGTFPPRLGVGDRVNVWPGPSEAAVANGTAAAAPLAAGAVVTSVGAADSLGTSVVTMLVDAQSAPKVSQATSLSVIEVAPNPVGQP